MEFRWNKRALTACAVGSIAVAGLVIWQTGRPAGPPIIAQADAQSAPPVTPVPGNQTGAIPAPAPPTLDLNEKQVSAVTIAPVGTHVFAAQTEAVGSIDFNEDLSVQVYPPYQGKIITAVGGIGDRVAKGTLLYTIDSPDLLNAESNLISAAATYDQNNRAYLRDRKLYDTQGTGGIAEKDLEAALQAQISAEGALRAARDAVRVFGKTDAEIDAMISKRKVDPVMVVNSPIDGEIVARNAQPGLFVQPGTAPAPFAVADLSTMWMLANVPEIDTAAIRLGQAVKVGVISHPDTLYDGTVVTVGATVDASLHTLLVRSIIRDPRHELRPGMMGHFVIATGTPVTATALPADGIVREGDGTMTAWVTTDRRHFTQRIVRLGLQRDGYDQILDGLQPGELAVTGGAVFLDAMLAPSTDD